MSVLKRCVRCEGEVYWCEGSPEAGGLVGEGTFVGEEAGGGVPVSFITSSPPDTEDMGVTRDGKES